METILCPTDFSPPSENAIHYANELAQYMNSRLVLFHSIYEVAGTNTIAVGMVPYAEPIRVPEHRQEQQAKLETLKHGLKNLDWQMPVKYESAIRYGLIQNTIPQIAQEVEADLIVLPNQEKSTLKNLLEGSVMANIIKSAPCPVLVIPPETTFKPWRKIVFTTDLQGEPFTDVSFLIKLASVFKAEILILHILQQDLSPLRQKAEAEFNRLHKLLEYQKVSFHLIVQNNLQDGVSQFCREHKADMMVIGHHPRSYWQYLFTQDDTQQMAYHTTLPLLIIHFRS